MRVAEDWSEWLERNRRLVDDALAEHISTVKSTLASHSRLPDAVEYSVRVGGKRVRPVLVLETCRVCGGTPDSAIPAAVAVELIHTFSLIHDDLPAMDDDALRRGKPTNHKVYGEAQAILAGDWLATHALALLASDRYEPRLALELIRVLADGTLAMIEGQGADIDGEGAAPSAALVEFIHAAKTARLIEACCRMGAMCAGAPSAAISAMAQFGRHLGQAFQITDDLLDVTGSAERTGKEVGKDADVSKQTYPAVFGIEESRERAAREVEAALAALENFGPRADRLRDVARYTIARDR